MKPLLSVCIIAKNEEKVINRCLESIYGIADEIIVVDTGSVDRTKDIAIKFTNKVYDFEWVDDFSKARNFAGSKATGEWIFVIDADEFVERESFQEFKEKLDVNPPSHNILNVQIVSFTGVNGKNTYLNYHERVYKNDGNISYYRNIHELLMHKDSKEDRGVSNLKILHSGYMKETMIEKNKKERNLSLLLKKENKDPMDYFYIGNEYRIRGDMEKAILYYQKAYKFNIDLSLEWVVKLLFYLVDCLHFTNRDEEALEIIYSCEEIYANVVDFKFYKGKIFYDKKQLNRAKAVFEEIISQKGDYIVNESLDFLELLPYKYLGQIYEKENDLQKAVHSYSQALSINQSDDELWIKLITLLGNHSSLEELVVFLNKNMINKQEMTPVKVAKILLMVPNINIQKLSRSLLNEQELTSVENDALLIKNYYLDGNHEAVIRRFENKSDEEIVSLLATGIYSVSDFILLIIQTNNLRFREMVLKINFGHSLKNLLNMLFMKKNKKLTQLEENFFISLYKQANVLGHSDLVDILNSKKGLLSKKCRDDIKEVITNIS